ILTPWLGPLGRTVAVSSTSPRAIIESRPMSRRSLDVSLNVTVLLGSINITEGGSTVGNESAVENILIMSESEEPPRGQIWDLGAPAVRVLRAADGPRPHLPHRSGLHERAGAPRGPRGPDVGVERAESIHGADRGKLVRGREQSLERRVLVPGVGIEHHRLSLRHSNASPVGRRWHLAP